MSVDEYLEYWGAEVRSRLPKNLAERFNYIVDATEAFGFLNYTGRACLGHVWPEFFKSFAKGRIDIFELDKLWFEQIWKGQCELANSGSFREKYHGHISPQEMSGLQVGVTPTMLSSA